VPRGAGVRNERIGLAPSAAKFMNLRVMHPSIFAVPLSLRHVFRSLLASLAMFAVPALAEEPALIELRQLMRTVTEEMMAKKTDALTDHAHPAVVALIGGKEKAREMLPRMMLAELTKLEELGFRVKSYEVAPPENIRQAGEWTFALVPTTMVTEGEKGRFTMKSHLLACRKTGGTKWYLFRLGLPEAQVRQLLPEIPADYTWPEKEAPKFEPK
jgi:hypothetical protein